MVSESLTDYISFSISLRDGLGEFLVSTAPEEQLSWVSRTFAPNRVELPMGTPPGWFETVFWNGISS